MDANVSLIQAIKSDPTFQALVSKRTRFSWALTTAMLAIYFGFIGVVAFVPQWLGTFVSGATTIGIPVGLAVIAAAFALTGLYVYRANSEFDRMTRQIIEKVK